MVIYLVPVAVTQAKVQLVIDETARAPVPTINNDVQASSRSNDRRSKRRHERSESG
jgi:hypothetical protein